MNKAELVDAIAKKAELPIVTTTKILNHLLEVVVRQLSKKDSITLIGFGTFKVVDRKAREGRNPKTGETMKIAATKAARFVPGKSLKESVANGKLAKTPTTGNSTKKVKK